MRVLKLEIKRIMKTRRTIVLLALSFFFTVWMAYLPVTYVGVTILDEAGEESAIEGREAIAYIKEMRKSMAGVVTPEKIRQALEAYQACLQEYGVENQYELPGGVYGSRLLPYSQFFGGIREAYADRDTGMAPSIMEIAPEQVENYYAACEERLDSLMKMEQKDNPKIQQKALNMYRNVEQPYQYYPAYPSDAMEYEGFLAMILLLFGAIIAAPVFSSDYQTGADDILRCTKHGRVRLGVAKIITAAGITSILFTVCMLLYVLISNYFFGWESVKTSMQLEFSITNLVNWNIGKLQFWVALAGLMSIMATVCFTLFLSSRCKNVVTSLSIGLLICFVPFFFNMIFSNLSQKVLWTRSLLPSSGICPPSSFLYEAADYHFLKLGNFVMWVPYAEMVFAGIEIILFTILAVRSYVAHKG